MYHYILKQRQQSGELWTSSEVFTADDLRSIRHAVIVGYLSGEPRWAETAPDDMNPGFFLYGLNRLGKACETGTADPDFSE